jgi:hypothetical protein
MRYRKRILNLSMTILVGGNLSPLLAIAGAQTNSPSAQESQTARKEISRERAIEIARERIDFKPKGIKAVKVIEDNRKVWRVTFRGEPISKVHVMGETMIVSVDRFTGEIVSVSKS